ncbi:ParB/Srx family N-terminal domain-containing protein [Pseudescherichia vulneris]
MSEKLKIVYRPHKELVPYARNAMEHSEAQINQIAESIGEFGWTNPILIDEAGEIIAGHGRVLAAEQMGYDPVPTVTLAGLTAEQKRAYRLADNQLPRNGGWNDKLLGAEITELQDLDFDIGVIGFSDLEIGNFLGVEPDNPADHWEGMPDFNQEDKNGFHRMVVHFETEADVQNFATLVGQKITEKTKFIWYPEHQRDQVADKAYISDESTIPTLHSQQGPR